MVAGNAIHIESTYYIPAPMLALYIIISFSFHECPLSHNTDVKIEASGILSNQLTVRHLSVKSLAFQPGNLITETILSGCTVEYPGQLLKHFPTYPLAEIHI